MIGSHLLLGEKTIRPAEGESEFVWKIGGKSVGRALRRPLESTEKIVEFLIGAL